MMMRERVRYSAAVKITGAIVIHIMFLFSCQLNPSPFIISETYMRKGPLVKSTKCI